MKNILKKIGIAIVIIFALIGLFLTAGYVALKLGLTNSKGIIDTQRDGFLNSATSTASQTANSYLAQNLGQYYWQTLPEWQTLQSAILKDRTVINAASADSGVPARLIISNLIAEQFRFFFDDRESYKKFFAPLKILGSQTQFSWGVMGIKEFTAVQVENNLKDKASLYYLGPQFEHTLDYATSTNVSTARFLRMTDQHNHYYSYLYAGLYLNQIMHQWKAAGFDISNRYEILSTLYNIGFTHSLPNADPKSGGAPIPIGNQVLSFGTLASQFYNSNELVNEFPK